MITTKDFNVTNADRNKLMCFMKERGMQDYDIDTILLALTDYDLLKLQALISGVYEEGNRDGYRNGYEDGYSSGYENGCDVQ